MANSTIAKASVGDSIAVFNEVIVPTAAKGVIIRRRHIVQLAERMDWDQRAVRRLQRLRHKHGAGPVMLSTPGQPRALILSPAHVRRVLEESPQTFSTASNEKVAPLAHAEPRNALITEGWDPADRQRFNDEVIDSGRNIHRLADHFLEIIHEETDYLIKRAARTGELLWEDFYESWFRMIRLMLFGEGAADDRELVRLMEKLRAAANWSFMHPGLPRLRSDLIDRVKRHLDRAEPGTLAGRIAEIPKTVDTAPHHQVPQYLFAAEAAAIATYRTMALLAAHPVVMNKAQQEVDSHGGHARANLPLVRAAVLESLRLWPTSPLILRQTTTETTWDGKTMPEGTTILIFAPFFHRDDANLDYAHRFAPEIWLRDRDDHEWPLIPFGGGPAICPGRSFVLLMAGAVIGGFLEKHDLRVDPPGRLRGDRPMPGTLNHLDLRFSLLDRGRGLQAPDVLERAMAQHKDAPVPVRGVGKVHARLAGAPKQQP